MNLTKALSAGPICDRPDAHPLIVLLAINARLTEAPPTSELNNVRVGHVDPRIALLALLHPRLPLLLELGEGHAQAGFNGFR